MKATTLSENISKAIITASRFVSNKSQLPILSNILLKAEKNKIIINATNLETSISINIGAKVEENGEIAIPSKIISDLFNNIPSGQVLFESEKERLLIKSSMFESVILGTNTSDFPSVTQLINNTMFRVSSSDMENIVKKTLFSVSSDETRPILTGVLIVIEKNLLEFVATDGFRLSRKVLNLPKGNIKDETKLIVPRNTFAEVLRLCPNTEFIDISYDSESNQIIFAIGDYILSSRIIQGDFPDYKKVIPTDSTVSVEVDNDDLLRAVKLASIFARDAAGVIKLQIKDGKLNILAESSKSGSQNSTIDAKIEGEDDFVIAYNYRFLEEWLNCVEGSIVNLNFTNPSTPGLFSDPKDPDYLHIIMPVKLNS